MGKFTPINEIPPTYSSHRQIKFTNIDSEDFVHAMGGKKYKFRKGVSILLPENMAYHFAKNLANKIVFRDDDSILKYNGVDERVNKENVLQGKAPVIKGIEKEVFDQLIDLILNHPEPGGQLEPEITDIEDVGQVIREEPKSENKPKKGRPPKEKTPEFAELPE